MHLKQKLLFAIILLLLIPSLTLAEIPEQFIQDFSSIRGSIIMPVGNEYLVDLDASNDIHVGDIFSVLMAGEKIVQPTTKVVTGTVDRPKAYLQITKIKSGYSYATLLPSGATPQKGDMIDRFKWVPTLFQATEGSEILAAEVKKSLANLIWLPDGNKKKPLLIFSLENNTLRVKDFKGDELKAYNYSDNHIISSRKSSYQTDNFQIANTREKKSLINQTIDTLASTIGLDNKDKRLENPGITQDKQLNSGIWISQNLDGNPVGITVADFDDDGNNEIAVALENNLKIIRLMNSKEKLIAKLDPAAGVRSLSIDSADLNNDGKPEIYLSASTETALSSRVFQYIDNRYKATDKKPWIFRKLNMSQEGKVLLAQAIHDPKNPLESQPFKVILSDQKLSEGNTYPMPRNATIFSTAAFTSEQGGDLYAYISSNGSLHIETPKRTELWSSDSSWGGSEVYFKTMEDTENKIADPIYIQQRLFPLDSGEILVAKNEGFRLLERYKQFDKSRIVALKWNGNSLQQTWSTSEQDGYLADFTVADADNDGVDELVMAVKYKSKNLLQKGRSNIVIYELNAK